MRSISALLVTLALLLGVAFLVTGCSNKSVRGVSAGIAQGAAALKSEVADGVRSGDFTAEEVATLNPILDEIGDAAGDVSASAINWEQMGPADRLALTELAVGRIGGAVERLSAAGIGVKSERGRRQLERRLRDARLGLMALRVVEASLRPPDDSQAR